LGWVGRKQPSLFGEIQFDNGEMMVMVTGLTAEVMAVDI
jgi:hypothetical protein